MEFWEKYLASDENEGDVNDIRKHTLVGRPLGTSVFIAELGKKAGRVLSVLPRGRPKKRSVKK